MLAETVLPVIQTLEDRVMMSGTLVTTTADSGLLGSLRYAIASANQQGGNVTIQFAIPTSDSGYSNNPSSGNNTWAIHPTSALPAITAPGIIIDGATQTAAFGNQNINGPEIEIVGDRAGGVNGLEITGGGDAALGLVIRNFQHSGVWIHGASNASISGCYIGTSYDGQAAAGNGFDGVAISGGSQFCVIGGSATSQGNLISANGWAGVEIDDFGTAFNSVQGNVIGLNSSHNAALGNKRQGVFVVNANSNTIGDPAALTANDHTDRQNIICASGQAGVTIVGGTGQGNLVQGNTIGSDLGFGNAFEGIYVDASLNTIKANRCAGNGFSGITLADPSHVNNHGNVLSHNVVVLSPKQGILVNSASNTIDGNHSDANGTNGIEIIGSSNVVKLNYAFYNGSSGIVVINALSKFNTIDSNVTFNNAHEGILIQDADLNTVNLNQSGRNGGAGVSLIALLDGPNAKLNSGNTVSNNDIYDNSGDGVYIGGRNNTVNGNSIRGNLVSGVRLFGTPAHGNSVYSNTIENDPVYVRFSAVGVLLTNGAHDNAIGKANNGNSICASSGDGVRIDGPSSGASAIHNTLIGNFIGISYQQQSVPNRKDGIAIFAPMNTVSANVISANHGNGVHISGTAATRETVTGNFIGTDPTGNAARGNEGDGILIDGGAGNEIIGGTATGLGNVVSGNRYAGIAVIDTLNALGNTILGNLVGLGANGDASVGNGTQGIFLDGLNNVIGGTASGAANVISGNGQDGVWLTTLFGDNPTSASTTTIQGNIIGLSKSGQAVRPNGGNGIHVDTPSHVGRRVILVGGPNGLASGEGNFISGNKLDGVRVEAGDVAVVRGNSVHDNSGISINLAPNQLPVVTANDTTEADQVQNYPALNAVVDKLVSGSLHSTPNRSFTIDFYASPSKDPTGYGWGQNYLGNTTIITGADGNATFSVLTTSLTNAQAGAVNVPAGWYVSTTATGLIGTSEMSFSTPVVASSSIPTLRNAFSVIRLGDTVGGQKFFKIVVPAGKTKLTVTLTGGAGNADLYVGLAAPSSLVSYQARSITGTNDESITLTNPAAGTYYVMLNATLTYSGARLLATYF